MYNAGGLLTNDQQSDRTLMGAIFSVKKTTSAKWPAAIQYTNLVHIRTPDPQSLALDQLWQGSLYPISPYSTLSSATTAYGSRGRSV